MRTAVAEQLAVCRADLARLPRLLTADVTAEVIHCVVRFSDRLRGVVHGESDDKAFVHACRRRFALFERAIRYTAPDFRSELAAGEIPRPVALAMEDDTDKFGVDRYDDFTRLPKTPIALKDVTRIIEE